MEEPRKEESTVLQGVTTSLSRGHPSAKFCKLLDVAVGDGIRLTDCRFSKGAHPWTMCLDILAVCTDGVYERKHASFLVYL